MIINNQTQVKGTHILTLCDARSDKAKWLENKIESVGKRFKFLKEVGNLSEKLLKDLWQEYKFYLEALHKFKTQEFILENITTTIGRSVLAQRLSGTTTYTGTVNYTALGSNTTTPTVADATLGTEVYRKTLSSGYYLTNVAYLETFFTASETSGTYEEYGMFIDGTGVANTGQMFNRFTQSITKSVTETLNCASVITFNDA